MSKPELLPCPFCGGAAEIRTNVVHQFAICTACLAATDYLNSDGEVIAAWNRRSSPVPDGWQPSVKPLEWEDADEGTCTKFRAPALGGHYTIVVLDKDDGLFSVNLDIGGLAFRFILVADEYGQRQPEKFSNLDEAKAAAQTDYERRVLSALSIPAAPYGWQPIETAPKDGTVVDLHFPYAGRVVDLWWDDGWIGIPDDMRPTHWMPIPASPSEPPEAA